ncbi:MAG: caspase family protein [Bacteroidetes bacterium]|nr:caspase family protein [Bacteroidota bacterium]
MKKIILLTVFLFVPFISSWTQEVNIPLLQVSDPQNTFVAIIGNENYQEYYSDYTPNALHAIYDAERFKQYLINYLNIPERNISFYSDATTTHIKLYLSKLGRQAEKAGNRGELIFYFSGKYVEGGIFGNISLLPLDVLETDPAFAVTADEVFRKLESSPAKRITVLFDATLSTVSRSWSLLNDGGKPYNIDKEKRYAKIKAFITDLNKQSFDKETIAIHPEISVPQKESVPDNTPPVIFITTPDLSVSDKTIVEDKDILIRGKAEDKSGIYEVSVNGEEAHLESDGSFQAKVLLGMGENKITVQALDPKRNIGSKALIIERIPGELDKTKQVPGNKVEPDEDGSSTKTRYYALLIGINDYEDPAITSLDNPLNDSRKLYEILKTSYSFNEEDIILLLNAKREEIITALDKLETKLTENDNLLIFYAGHGYWDEKTGKGYWYPADAKYNNTANWIRNSTISGYISGIKSKHTLLIADACFSGGIFKTRAAFSGASRAINRIYELPSRKAMTSGTLKEVPDESIFLYYLIKNLQENQEEFLSAEKLFFSFKPAVLNNSENIPQFGVIKNAGDEGGDFIFLKR